MDIVKYTRDSAYQRIKAWYLDEESVELSVRDVKRKDRLVHIWALRFREKYSRDQVIQIAMSEHDISQATAYRDYALAQQLFGEIDAVNIEAERLVIAEAFWEEYQKARAKGDGDTAIKALKEYKSLYDFEDTGEKIDPRKLEASQYIMNLPRGASDLLKKMISGGVADFNQLTAEDVEFQEVEEEKETDEDE